MSANSKFWNSIDNPNKATTHRSDTRYLEHELTIRGEDSGFSSGAGMVVCHIEERDPGGMWI